MDRENAESQLIVTLHDTNLMTHDIWRADEIWFAEKRVDGSSDLYSLYQFTPRFDKRLEKGYRQGLYGAMPHIGGEMLNG
jgi:AAA15 family ATPase/GTPase